jgi:hypothetical protein
MIIYYAINSTYKIYPSTIWTLLTRLVQWSKSVKLPRRTDKLMGPNSFHAATVPQEPRNPPATCAQYLPTAPIPSPLAMDAGNSSFPHPEYTRITSGPLSVVADPPVWPTYRIPRRLIDIGQESSNDFQPPYIPVLEYRPMEHRGSYINHFLGPLSIESAQEAVGSGLHPECVTLSNDYSSPRMRSLNETNTRKPSEDAWVPFAHSPARQAASCKPSGGFGARVEVHPNTHESRHGQYGMYCSKRGDGVALSKGEMAGAE